MVYLVFGDRTGGQLVEIRLGLGLGLGLGWGSACRNASHLALALKLALAPAGRPTHTKVTPEQTGARARALVVSVVLTTKVLTITCQDASSIHSSVDRYLLEGLRAKADSHCFATL